MFLLNNKPLAVDTPFEVRGVRYPANWLRLSTAAEKQAIGITEVPDPVRPDERFYWVTQNEDGTFTSTPKDLADLQKNHVAQIKDTAGKLLAPTDWRVIRAQELGTPVDQATLDARAAIRSKSNLFEEAVMSAETVEELVTVLQTINWDD